MTPKLKVGDIVQWCRQGVPRPHKRGIVTKIKSQTHVALVDWFESTQPTYEYFFNLTTELTDDTSKTVTSV
jgi:hypothetical protein